MSRTFDVAVIGLGAVGSAAAYHAARAGHRVVGFDRFVPPHALGSSHGGSRIIRRAYFEGELYLPLLERAYALWRDLEEAMDAELLHLHGALTVAPRQSRVFQGALSTARTAGLRHRVLDRAELAEAYPMFHLRDGEAALLEEEAGWVDPEAAVRAHANGARRYGAVLRLNEPVRSWRSESGAVLLETAAARYSAGAVIICSGGWIGSLLPELGGSLKLERQVNVWYHPAARARDFRPDRCPVYIWAYDADRVLYGFPDAGDGVKAGLHHGGELARHPDGIDRAVHPKDIQPLTERLARLLPDACGNIARSSTCFYTNTPDERFIIDVHPEQDSVVLASACSGHGFKMSNAVGENVARLAAGEKPSVDLRPYRLSRTL